MFELNKGTLVSQLHHEGSIFALALGAQGTPVVIAGPDNITLFESGRNFNTSEPKELLRLSSDATILALAFSPDGKRLGIAISDGSVRILDAATGSESSRIKREDPVSSVVFTLNGSDVITAAGTSEVEFKRDSLSSDTLIEAACSRLTNNLSRDQWKDYLRTESYFKICPLLPEAKPSGSASMRN